ncbi:MAG TPA: hypothetical protein VFN67_32340 [Polyangiales bacterium]|nr:hypothetical protein [Polyangiales bacterium]
MATCIKRGVLNANDRLARSAAEVESAGNDLARRVVPHAGAPRRNNAVPWGRPLQRGAGAAPGGDPIADAMRGLSRALTNFVRDATEAINEATAAAQPGASAFGDGRLAIRIVYQPYTEPMEIPGIENMSIAAVSCARVVVTQSPDEYLRSGSHVDWRQNSDVVTVRSIDGLTPGDPRILTFTFVYFGV